jgi:hypothetical protein
MNAGSWRNLMQTKPSIVFVPMLSNPKLVLDVIRKAALAVQTSPAVQSV